MSLKAFIKIPVQKGTYKRVEKVCEKDDKHLVLTTANFCPTCGSKIVARETDYHVHLSLRDMLPNNNGQLNYHVRDEFMYIFSNILEDDDDWLDIVTIDSVYIAIKVKMFNVEHSELIKELEDYLGHGVTIQFGYINLDSELDW